MAAGRTDANIFINCPFDPDYQPILRAIVFTIYDCGYVPRSALEGENGGDVRIERLYRLIRESHLGIHDISRTTLDKANKLPRFNMPLELGMFLGAKRFGGKEHAGKVCLILDNEKYRYQKFLSDIAGQDIRAHDDDPQKAILAVRNWIAANARGVALPGAATIRRRYKQFNEQLPMLCDELGWEPDEISHPDFEHLVSTWLKVNAGAKGPM
jgi:hypothetical protein